MKKKFLAFCSILIMLGMLASACAPAATQAPAEATVPPATTAVQQNTAVPPTATTEPTIAPTESPSLVGGTLSEALTVDPDTLDPQKTYLGASNLIMMFIYSSLIAKDAQGNYVPYLATSWEVAPDGMTYTFHLRQDVKFHNGDPLTAEDVAYTYTRELDPATASVQTTLSAVDTVEALDDYTVQFTMKNPNYYILESLVREGEQGVMDKAVLEAQGQDYGREPIGTGPYMFKEWITGDHVTLERNPDFVWGPPFTNGTPPNIETIVYRIIPESATIVAGLEAEEIDYVLGSTILPTDTANLQATGMFNINARQNVGMYPYISLNLEKAPFDDVRVRQALNYATNKQALMDIVAPDSGDVIQNGPLSATQEGYWLGIEEMGYAYDLEKAKQLMLDAGYTYNADGMLEKDGQPLSFELIMGIGYEMLMKPAEIIQSQWKELGVDVKLVQEDFGVAVTDVIAGNYSACMFGTGAPASDMLTMFHSNQIGAGNFSRANNPELDAILDQMTTATDTAVHLQAAQDAQKMIVEQAYVVTLFSQVSADVISSRVKGYVSDAFYGLRFWDAYIEQ
jgi:peptide/nickel transport system substrate-binding protein